MQRIHYPVIIDVYAIGSCELNKPKTIRGYVNALNPDHLERRLEVLLMQMYGGQWVDFDHTWFDLSAALN